MTSAHESKGSTSDQTPPVIEPPVTAQTVSKPSWSEQHPHAWVLVICIGIIVLAFLLRIDSGEFVVVPWLNLALPQTCMFRNMTSLNCPGCGLTRSFISLADGHWYQAWQFNPVGWMIFILVVVQIPFRMVQLVRLRSGREALVFPGALWLTWSLMILLIAQWLVRGMGRW